MKMNKRILASLVAATLTVGAAGTWAETTGTAQDSGVQQPAATPVTPTVSSTPAAPVAPATPASPAVSATPAAPVANTQSMGAEQQPAAAQQDKPGKQMNADRRDGPGKRMGADRRDGPGKRMGGDCNGMGGKHNRSGMMQRNFMGGMPYNGGMMQRGFMGGMPYNGGMMQPSFIGVMPYNGGMMQPGFIGVMPYNGGMMQPNFMSGQRNGGMMPHKFMGGMNHGDGMKHHKFKGEWQQKDLKLDVSKVKTLMDAYLIRHGKYDELHVGEITSGENNTFNVNFLDADNTVVKTLKISGKTGRPVGDHKKFGDKGGDSKGKMDKQQPAPTATPNGSNV